MGVHGLWKLIEPSGQMVPLESLAGKVLAVDVSIWLHQAVKGMQDASGAPVAVAHILILFHRICKLLFYKIKPVFVFDGGVPALKHQTMTARRQHSGAAKSEAMKVRQKLIKNLLKHEAVRQVLSNETASAALGLNSFTLPGPSVEEDLYKLPPIAADFVDSESENASSEEEENERHFEDIHSVDVTSKEFLSLPPEIRHDILTELIDTRKQSSWKYLDSMPKKSDNFSDFQMNRLLKRRAVQTSLEKAGKEMGGRALSLKELESLLGEQGVLDPTTDLPSRRIAQDSVTRYMLVQKDLENNLENPKNEDKKSKGFDIMNRLEGLDWSSESDTDVILRKSPEEIVETKESKELGKKLFAEATIKTEPLPISAKPKVRMTEEIANILSVLEDEDVDINFKMKVKDFQSRINVNEEEKVKLKRVEMLENFNNEKQEKSLDTKSFSGGSNDTSFRMDSTEILKVSPENLDLKNIQTDVDEIFSKDKNFKGKPLDESEPEFTKIAIPFHENKNLENYSGRVYESSLKPFSSEILDVNKTESESKLPGEVKTLKIETQSPKDSEIPVAVDNIENKPEITESSSDSETDFSAVGIAEAENLPLKTETETDYTVNKDISISSKPLTITINPLETESNDDIFADVFHTVPETNEEKEVKEGREKEIEKDGNVETADKNARQINEYEAEFRKEITKGSFMDLKETLEDQQLELIKEKGRQERLALSISDQMYQDAQELLRYFGIPFIIAPMEAEAQCATLNSIGLTEGTITDDSDIWLFGGRVVYKNFFNQNKHVLEYRSEDIQKYFKLSREDMIKMALLVGSDYTTGLNGIGPVTALEILASFQTSNQDLLDGLKKFRDWFIGKTKSGPPRTTLKKKIKNTVMSPGFPNRAVAEAYLHPQVDDSKEPFSWAKPNLELIKKYAKLKMGWSPEKCNELLQPVFRKLEEGSCQNIIERYFKIVQKTSPIEGVLSKRVESAIKRLGGSVEEESEECSKPKRKRKPKKTMESTEVSVNAEEEDKPKPGKKARIKNKNDIDQPSKAPVSDEPTKTKLINQKLHQDVKIPQKEVAQQLKEERKKKAAEIFRTYNKGGKKKLKVFAKEEVKLSESSSEDD